MERGAAQFMIVLFAFVVMLTKLFTGYAGLGAIDTQTIILILKASIAHG